MAVMVSEDMLYNNGYAMTTLKQTAVQITTFINPHLFWIFYKQDVEKREALEKSLQAHITKPLAIQHPDIRQHVLVHDKTWKRALVYELNDFSYTCWLIDYGVLLQDCRQVYKIPDQYNAKPALAKQAALAGVVNVKQIFDINGFKSAPTVQFSPASIKWANDRIRDARAVFFECVSEKDNIHRGNINILRTDGHLYDLSTDLVEGGVLAFNAELFEQALKENSEMGDAEFFLLTRPVSPCPTPVKKKSVEVQDVVKDIAESKGLGRGTCRTVHVKETLITPRKKTFVEDWLQDVKKVSTPELNYESDDSEDTSFDTALSNSNSRSDSLKNSSEKSKPVARQLRSEQTKNTASMSSNLDKTPDTSRLVNTSSELPRRPSKSPGAGSWTSSSDSVEVDYYNKSALDTKSESSSISCKQRRSTDLNDRFLSIVKGRGRRSTESANLNKSEVGEGSVHSETSSVNEKYISILQKKLELQHSPVEKAQDMEVKSAPAQTNEKFDFVSKNLQLAPKQGIFSKEQDADSPGMRPVEPKVKAESKKQDECKETKQNEPKQTEKIEPKQMGQSELQRTTQNERTLTMQAQLEQLRILPAGMRPKELHKKKETKVMPKSSASTSYPSRANSSASSANSIQKLIEFGRELSNPRENPNCPVELLKQNCTQGCKCQQCKELYTIDLYPINKEFVDTEPKKQKVHVKPTPLLRTESDQSEDVEIKSHTSIASAATQLERAGAPKILVHGSVLPSPTTSVTAVPFHADIHRVLQPFEQAYTIQSYVWPAIMRHTNICMVSASKSGKTMAYLPAICSYLLERQERYEDLPGSTISPIAIILCPGSKVADNVYDLMLKLIEHSQNKPNSALAVPPLDKRCLNQFRKQCDILITTPVMLISLLKSRIITVKRLCHFVIECADRILEKFSTEVDSLLNLMQSMLEHRNCRLSVQMIVSTEHWTLPLENFVKKLHNTPIVCISSYLEAALYGRVDIRMQFLESKSKMYKLADLLKKKAAVCKTLVICNNDSEIEETKEFLNLAGVNTVFIYDNMGKQEIIEAETKWHYAVGGKYLALVCTDQVYSYSLNISDAVLLVHYSLPDTWTWFANRFSCLLDNYASPLASKLPSDWVRCEVHIFVDEACTKQFPKLVQFLQRMSAKLLPKFTEKYKETIEAREMEKIANKIKLCPNLKLFGKCWSDNRQLCCASPDSQVTYSSLNCRKRHILSVETDYSSNLPKSGIVKFKIVHIQDVTSFTVKLLEHTDGEGKVHKWKKYENLRQDLQDAMAEQQVCVFDAKVGQWYAFYSEEERSYSRCTVKKVLAVEKITKLASFVTIRCLDTGVEKSVSTAFLYELPKKFRSIPAQGVDVFLANMVPPDSDESFSVHSKSKVRHLLEDAGYQKDSVYGIGQILLQLQGVIWLKNILLCEKLLAVDTTVTRLNLRKALQGQNLVSYSEEPLQALYGLCKKTGIELPDYSKLPAAATELENKTKQQAQPQWAYFEDCDCNEVYIACVDTPSLFYVRLKKFYNLLEALQKEIQETIAKPFYPSDFEVEVGKYYLAKDFAGDDYCRVKVVEIKDNIANCFYVDFGDYANIDVADIKYLTDQLIVKLPFQAIECRLYGVQPSWGAEWESSAVDVLCDYIFEPNTDYFRTLFTTTCKQEPATATGGQRCAILLVDNFKKIIIVNQLLIDCGEAMAVKDEDLDKEFNIPKVYTEADDDPDVDDVEEKELTFEEVERLATKYKADDMRNNNNRTLQTVDCDVDADRCKSSESIGSVPSWDIVIDDPETFMKQLIGVNVDDNRAISNEPELPPMRALPPSDHCLPDVVWHQTENLIKMNILLPNLNDYILRVVRKRALLFKTIHDGKQYRMELVLFDKVESAFEHSPCGQHLKVILHKCVPIEWPRLVTSSGRMRNIRYDISCLVLPEEQKKTFLQISAGDDEVVKDNECVVDIGSDEDYSESDVESLPSD